MIRVKESWNASNKQLWEVKLCLGWRHGKDKLLPILQHEAWEKRRGVCRYRYDALAAGAPVPSPVFLPCAKLAEGKTVSK